MNLASHFATDAVYTPPFSTSEAAAAFVAVVLVADLIAFLTVLDKDRHQRFAWWPLEVARPDMFIHALVVLNILGATATVFWLLPR